MPYTNYHDYDRQAILDKYIGYLINKNKGSFSDRQERHRCCFDLDNLY